MNDDKLLYVNQVVKDEHDSDLPSTKKVLMYGWDIDNLQKRRLSVGADGSLSVNLANQLVPEKYDEIALSYTGENLTSVVYKQGGSVVATLTLGYSGSKLISVVKT